MILMPDLFSFAYVPNWYSQLDMLEEMALPEPWRFKNPIYLTKNPDTPILERYIHAIFKKQLIDYTSEQALYRLLRFFMKIRAPSRRCASPFVKATLGSLVRLRRLHSRLRPSRQLAVATNFLAVPYFFVCLGKKRLKPQRRPVYHFHNFLHTIACTL